MCYKATLFLLIMILSLTGLYSCNKNFLLLWDANNIYVSTRDNIDKDKIKIEFGISVNTINEKRMLNYLLTERSIQFSSAVT